MSAPNDGGPAFPGGNAYPELHCKENSVEAGMTLRDYFAAKAMQGIFSSDKHCDDCGNFSSCALRYYTDAAVHAYNMADAMLKVREAKS